MDIEAYSGEPHQDRQLVAWWSSLVSTGEIRDVFHEDLWALGAFMAYWRGGTRTLLIAAGSTSDGHSIFMGEAWACAWYEPLFDGATIGLWLAPAHRKSKAGLQVIELFHRAGFARWPRLIGITRQKRMSGELLALGYTEVGVIPALWGGFDVWIWQVTQEAFRERIFNRERPVGQADNGHPGPGTVGVYQGDC